MLKRLIVAGAMLTGAGLAGAPAHAAFVITLTEHSGNVVETGSGKLDLTDLTFNSLGGSFAPSLTPSTGEILSGSGMGISIATYTGYTGPMSFGTGSDVQADTGAGDILGLQPQYNNLYLPASYVSGDALSTSAFYGNQTFTSLGVTPGVYKWTWGSGDHKDSFTLDIGTAAPEPSTWAMMLAGFVGLGALALRRGDWRRA
jgi:PEP-CTERM motif